MLHSQECLYLAKPQGDFFLWAILVMCHYVISRLKLSLEGATEQVHYTE